MSPEFMAVAADTEVRAQSSIEDCQYDALGRLIVVEVSGGQNDDEVHALRYDAVA